MGKADRERRHQANLDRIQRVQLVVGRGDRMKVDHEGTLLERARLMMEEVSSHEATERGLEAFDRLLQQLERSDTRQPRDVATFLTAIWNQKPLSLAILRGQDQGAGDDMVDVLNAYRYARLSLPENVPGGARRVARVLGKWALANA